MHLGRKRRAFQPAEGVDELLEEHLGPVRVLRAHGVQVEPFARGMLLPPGERILRDVAIMGIAHRRLIGRPRRCEPGISRAGAVLVRSIIALPNRRESSAVTKVPPVFGWWM
jgi:hypothetical protein